MEDYLIHTKESFNKIADSFDEEDHSNAILQWMRKTVYEIYFLYFKKGDKLIELNAGTGIDAVYLASNGIKVFATDISDEMIGKLKVKISNENLNGMIEAENFSFDDIQNITDKNFDGAVSNFGGLNCINNFENLSESLAGRIKPGGIFIASVMNSFCPWEIFYFLMKLDHKNAFRRFHKEGIDANLSEFKVKSFYFSPKEFARQFQNDFEIEKIYTLGLFTPPPYLYGIYNKAKPIVKIFMKLDNFTKGIFPFNKSGDHFVIVLKRK
ncbi:MAG: methyltransferase domain-containing protein [bacterium]